VFDVSVEEKLLRWSLAGVWSIFDQWGFFIKAVIPSAL
jgi:hypothetical protein